MAATVWKLRMKEFDLICYASMISDIVQGRHSSMRCFRHGLRFKGRKNSWVYLQIWIDAGNLGSI